MDRENDCKNKATALYSLTHHFDLKDVQQQEVIKMWLRSLDEFTPEQVYAGAAYLIKNHEYPVIRPANLIAAIRKVCNLPSPEKLCELAAANAWQQVLDAVSKYGRGNKPAFEANIEHALRCAGGWERVCNANQETLTWIEKRFVSEWQNMALYGDIIQLGNNNLLALIKGQTALNQPVGTSNALPEPTPQLTGSD